MALSQTKPTTTADGPTSVDDITEEPIDISDRLNPLNFPRLFGTTCPTLDAITLMGQTIHINITPWCQLFTLIGYFVLAASTLVSIRIIGAL